MHKILANELANLCSINGVTFNYAAVIVVHEVILLHIVG